MNLILHIDTASDTALISLAENGNLLQEEINTAAKDHAAFLQPAIQSIIKKAGLTLMDIDAVAVIAGPGSYTGLRVGMASAKGLCFALNKPLITIGSLEAMAADMIWQHEEMKNANFLFCPMIDARRLEVFTAVYNAHLNIILEPAAMILEENSFSKISKKQKIVFFGNGSTKWEQIYSIQDFLFLNYIKSSKGIRNLALTKFINKDFSDLVSSEPFYLKNFHTIK